MEEHYFLSAKYSGTWQSCNRYQRSIIKEIFPWNLHLHIHIVFMYNVDIENRY